MYKLVIFTPRDHAFRVKQELFRLGAGKQGHYDSCCFDCLGIGQFRPLKGSNPFVGRENRIEYVEEVRSEMLVDEEILEEVIKKLKEVHPYEEPAYDIIKIETL